MGCNIVLTHTITHHLHLAGTEVKTETVGAYLQIAYMCMRMNRCRDPAVFDVREYLCVRLLFNWMGGRAKVKSRLHWIIKRN